jgi:hypothetical protein
VSSGVLHQYVTACTYPLLRFLITLLAFLSVPVMPWLSSVFLHESMGGDVGFELCLTGFQVYQLSQVKLDMITAQRRTCRAANRPSAGSGWSCPQTAPVRLATRSVTLCPFLSQFSNGPLPGGFLCQGCLALVQLGILVEL